MNLQLEIFLKSRVYCIWGHISLVLNEKGLIIFGTKFGDSGHCACTGFPSTSVQLTNEEYCSESTSPTMVVISKFCLNFTRPSFIQNKLNMIRIANKSHISKGKNYFLGKSLIEFNEILAPFEGKNAS